MADFIRGVYKNRVQGILHPLEKEINRATEELQNSHSEKSLDLLEKKLLEWDKYAQPIQLIEEGKGFDEKRSSEICNKLRDIALHLHNNEDKSEISLRITKLLHTVFPELPEAAKDLAHDLDALEKIVDEKHRGEKLKKRLAAFKNAVANAAVANASSIHLIETFLAVGVKPPAFLIDALSALLNEYPELASEEKLWFAGRDVAVEYHNKHGATGLALHLTNELLALAKQHQCDQSIYEKFNDDKNVLEKIVSRSKATVKKSSNSGYLWAIGIIIYILILFLNSS